MLKHRLAAVLAGVMLCVAPAAAQEKVILDSDYTTIGDDGVITLLGLTVVAGNNWLPQEVSDALKAVEPLQDVRFSRRGLASS